MELVIRRYFAKEKVRSYLFDLAALALIFFTPAISHLLAFPVYLFEPMRIMLILSIAHTEKKNAYAIAFLLPLFSFLISSHPSPVKAGLISAELVLNVWLFYFLTAVNTGRAFRVKNVFAGMLIAVVASKIIYYLIKAGLMSAALLSGEFIATPLFLQVVVSLVLSVYIYIIYNMRGKNV